MIATIAAIAGKRSAIVPIMWKPLFSNRSDHSNHMETSPYGNCLAIKVAATAHLLAIIWKPAFNCTDNTRSYYVLIGA